MPELASAAKWLFIHSVVVRLRVGGVWQRTCECTHILRVVGESTKDGEVLSYAQETADNNVYIWPNGGISARCDRVNGPRSTKFTSYKIDRISDNQFTVYPPVTPFDPPRYALVECYRKPDSAEESFSIPDELIQAIKQWMLYRALIIDAENNDAIRDIAKTHFQVYQNCLASLKAQDKEQEEKRDGRDPVRAVQDSPSAPVQSGASI